MSGEGRLRGLPAWKALEAHHAEIGGSHMPAPLSRAPPKGAGLYLDYSKNRIPADTMRLLSDLAAETKVPERRDAMFSGSHINSTEDRAALHVALRMPKYRSLVVVAAESGRG